MSYSKQLAKKAGFRTYYPIYHYGRGELHLAEQARKSLARRFKTLPLRDTAVVRDEDTWAVLARTQRQMRTGAKAVRRSERSKG